MPGWTRCAVGSAQPQGCEIVRFWADTRGSGGLEIDDDEGCLAKRGVVA